MARSYAVLTLISLVCCVGASVFAGAPRCSPVESWEDLESDSVTLMQKLHTVSKQTEARVGAKHAARERSPPVRKAAGPLSRWTNPLAEQVAAAVPEFAEDDVAFFQDPGPIEAEVMHGAVRVGLVATAAASSAAAEASASVASVATEETMAEEVGERLGKQLAEELAAGAVDEPATLPFVESPSDKFHSVSVMQVKATESQTSLQQVQRARDSSVRAVNKMSSANPAGFVLSSVGVIVLLGCVCLGFAADGGTLRFRRQTSSRFQSQDSMAGDAKRMSVFDTNDSVVPRSVEAMPSQTFQSRRVGGGSQSGTPKVTEPPPFYYDLPKQDSFQSNQAAPVFREGETTIRAGEGPTLGSGQQAWSQQHLAPSADVLPALCPLLVLPACESHFAVPFDILKNGTAPFEFDIVGLSMTPLLHTCVKQSGNGGKCLEISMVRQYSWTVNSPHAMVVPAADSGSGTLAFEILGHARQLFGTLSVVEQGNPVMFVLTRQGESVVTIHKDEEGRMIRVLNPQGSPLCSVECVDSFSGANHLQFRVPPGVDAVLMLSCVLATFILVR